VKRGIADLKILHVYICCIYGKQVKLNVWQFTDVSSIMHVMRVHNHGTFKCELPVPVAFPRLHDYAVFSHGQQPEVESLHLSLSLLTMKGLEFGQFNEKFSCPLSYH